MTRERALIAALLLTLTGCTTYGKVQLAKIVQVNCGTDGCITVIQLEDGQRRARYGKWGEVGDLFAAQSTEGGLDGDSWR